MKRTLHAVTSGFRVPWSVVREAGATVLASELYPIGVATPSIPVIPAWTAKTRVQGTLPVLFLHGFLHNGSTFAWIKQRMALGGWDRFRTVNLSTARRSIPQLAEDVLTNIESMRQDFGVSQIDVIAHSMGGILARYVLQLMQKDGIVRNLITLGTPHQGTAISKYSVFAQLRELAPESPTIRQLRDAPVLTKTQAVSVQGNLDIVLWPRHCGHWEGVRNFYLRGVGHAGLLFSSRVTSIIFAHLRVTSPDFNASLHPRSGKLSRRLRQT